MTGSVSLLLLVTLVSLLVRPCTGQEGDIIDVLLLRARLECCSGMQCQVGQQCTLTSFTRCGCQGGMLPGDEPARHGMGMMPPIDL
ncbi:hypothetical protein MAR_011118 [Mya arenaria]|uniref:Uncharacterized protein n=1 Tax=Mya arenaria TaxID=6604 RepID=A0ABY7FWZ8_MYAAR|nr:hypothetical protein MAR_011118 [Mya arenaria]